MKRKESKQVDTWGMELYLAISSKKKSRDGDQTGDLMERLGVFDLG